MERVVLVFILEVNNGLRASPCAFPGRQPGHPQRSRQLAFSRSDLKNIYNEF